MIKEMVMIKWHDAKFFPGMHDERAISASKMALFDSLGYLVAKDDITTVIAAERNDQEEYRDITLIPSGSVISICKLTPGPTM